MIHQYFIMTGRQEIIKEYSRKTLMSDNMMQKILTRYLEILVKGGSQTRTLYMLKREMAVSNG